MNYSQLNKTTLLVLIFSLLLIGQDINTRLLRNEADERAVLKNFNIQSNVLPKVTYDIRQSIVNKYQEYRTEDIIETNDTVMMSEQEQALQTGELETAYIGNNKLKLKATLHNGTHKKNDVIALIQVERIKTKDVLIQSFQDKSNVYGYKINVLSNTQVELTKDNSGLQQTIILTMFKPSTHKDK